MQLTLTLRSPGGPSEPDRDLDLTVEVPERTPLAAVSMELTRAAGRPGAQLYAGTVPLAADRILGEGPLRHGAVLGVGTAVPEPARRDGLVELRVVGGPDAGAVYPLALGTAVLGRDPTAAIRPADPDLSAHHAELIVRADGVLVRDRGSRNGTRLDGAVVGAEPVPFRPRSLLRTGESTLTVGSPDDPPAAVRAGRDGRLVLNRPPRLLPERTPVTVALPQEPAARRPGRLPLLSALLPLAGGIAMALLWHSPQFLLLTVFSPILLIANSLAERRGLRRGRRRELAEHRERLATAEARLAAELRAEGIRRRLDHPDPARLWRAATGPGQLLWERRARDADALALRVGLSELPAEVIVERDGRPGAPPPVPDVPAVLHLRAHTATGVAGPAGPVDAVIRNLLVQLVTLHGPQELSVTLLCSQERAAHYAWMRWLPQLDLRFGLSAERQVQELLRELATRADTDGRAWDGPLRVVLLDRAAGLRALPGVPRLLTDGPAAGISALCVETGRRLLPAECRAVIEVGGEVGTRARLLRDGRPAIESIRIDGTGPEAAEQISRALAPFRAEDGDGSGAPPDTSRLLDLIPSEPAELLAAWTRAASTRVVLGESARGPLTIDLAADGPHALVAGTTGSGKSELLQSIIAGLAAGSSPEATTFVLIDYKGGAAFKDCAELPHTVGVVTDLDAHLTERALVSLTAELKYREQLFAAVGAKDLQDYRRVPGTPLPRLVLVIDEFASLVEELPEFVTGLVGIAMRGRSLGVHLILATQRPSGVVSPVIRANTNLRIALRVTDDGESRDVIDDRAAARIPTGVPGRAYLRIGSERPVEFQSARIGGPAAPTGTPASAVTCSPWPPVTAEVARSGAQARQTDLQRLVTAIGSAARSARLAPPRRPWLPPLPDRLSLAELPEQPGDIVPFALADRPREQRRELVALDLAAGQSMAIVGGPRSGRSSALHAIAVSAAQRYCPADLHFYVFDCAGGAQQPLSRFPHCGAICERQDVIRGDRVLTRLSAEIARRQDLLAAAGFASVAAQRATADPADRLPWILVLVDGWEGFAGAYEAVDTGRPVETLLALAREGGAAGVRVVVTGGRPLLSGRVEAVLPMRIVLRLGDPNDYTMAGLPRRAVPRDMPEGRGLLVDGATELQVAQVGDGPDQLAAVRAVGERLRRDETGRAGRPFRIRPLPQRIGSDELELPPERGPLWAPLGVAGDAAETVGVDLAGDGPGFLVAGPSRSGRSTALLTMALGLAAGGTRVVAIAPRRSALHALDDVVGCFNPAEHDLIADAVAGPCVVVVDELLACADSPIESVLLELLRADDGRHAVVGSGRSDELAMTFRGVSVALRASRSGLLLSPGRQDGDLLGTRLPRVNGAQPPGRGVLVRGGETTAVQVALPVRPGRRIGLSALGTARGQPTRSADVPFPQHVGARAQPV